MKFGDHLDESTVPEWKDKYINYKLGKKKLKVYKKNLEQQVLSNGNKFRDGSSTGLRNPAYFDQSARLRRSESLNNSLDNDYTVLQRKYVQDFIQHWLVCEELAKCNDFYSWLLEESRRKFLVLEDQLKCWQSHVNSDGVCAPGDICERDGRQDYGSISNTAGNEIVGFARKCEQFLRKHELMPSWPKGLPLVRRNLFTSHTGKETFGRNSMVVSTPQAQRMLGDALIEYYQYLQLVKTYRDLNVTGFRKMVKKFDKACKTSEQMNFMEYAGEHSLLFKHVQANIQLMAQKMKQTSSAQATGDLKVSNESEDPLTWWETIVTEWYVKDLARSSSAQKRHTQRLKKLAIQYTLSEQMIHRNNRAIAQMFFSGIGLGVSAAFIVYTLYIAFFSPYDSNLHTILFPLWGGWYMVLLSALLFLFNCYIWHRTGINYRFIMLGEIQAKNGTQLFNNDFAMSAISLKLYFLTFFLITCGTCAVLSFHWNQLSPYGPIYLGIVCFLFICPNGIFPYFDKLAESRKWLVTTLIRLMLSGLYPVEFGDFFIGDIICSLTYSMSDIALFFCYYSKTPNSLCGSSHSKAIGVLSCIPSYWRMAQCLRRLADSGDWFPHLLNAIKYAFGIAYYASLCAYRISSDKTTVRKPFVVLATFNSTVTAIWDIVMDWSLLQTCGKNWMLRNDLYLAGRRDWKTGDYSFKGKIVYYMAMVWDVLIRFQWIVYALAPQTIQQNAVTTFILAVTEVLRRFIWIIFRVENEHVANVHLFKVTGEVPLPYPAQRPETDVGSLSRSKASSSFSLSQMYNNLEEPIAAYHSLIRRQTGLLGSLSRSIPWAHASDFQRPRTYSTNQQSIQDSDSDSEMESVI
ncbi:hypothetical protein HG537_0D05740 [Torulaspora globosa]|uniref:EXS-domain-containing protein n=1 Tax=Torulaspora globosa TaxID=48254 RepID=A0A7H9HTL3_9SACH|nr:hypothetical protein HG537_0D05740 [Torulaspora sp. CBS 2947]